MQSAAARKLEDEDLALEAETSEEIEENTAASKDTEDEEKQEPQSKEPEIINVDLGDIGEDTYNSFNRRYEYLGKSKTRALLPTIIADLMRNCVVYLLAFAVTVLSIYKIIQVQNTVSLLQLLNEVNLNIENRAVSLLLQRNDSPYRHTHLFVSRQLQN